MSLTQAKRYKAHAMAREVWQYENRLERGAMYSWIARNAHKFGGKRHISEMNTDQLSVLMFEMGRYRELRDAHLSTIRDKTGGRFVKERPWLARYSRA